LSRCELLFNLGKGIAAAWAGNHKTFADLSFSPNLKADNWTNPREVSWGEKGWQVNKAAGDGTFLGDPMGSMGAATGEQYLINPIYETEIMQDAAKKSVMMNLVRHRPMMGPSIFLPTRDRGGVWINYQCKGLLIELRSIPGICNRIWGTEYFMMDSPVFMGKKSGEQYHTIVI
jgi:hypothetical protein